MVDLLHEEVAPDVPVLFSSHQLELVERLCDDLIILSAGKVVVAGATEELREGGPLRYRVVVADPAVLDDLPAPSSRAATATRRSSPSPASPPTCSRT